MRRSVCAQQESTRRYQEIIAELEKNVEELEKARADDRQTFTRVLREAVENERGKFREAVEALQDKIEHIELATHTPDNALSFQLVAGVKSRASSMMSSV